MRPISRICAIVLLAAVSGCQTFGTTTVNPLEGSNISNKLADLRLDRQTDQMVRQGIEALEQGDLNLASSSFNRALKFDPKNPHLHFLNGLTYHLMGSAGDSSQYDFAMVGYRLALQFDPSNYWAAYQTGRIHFKNQDYRLAQEAFAYALLIEPEEPALLKAMSVASYYAQDLGTALAATITAEKVAPNDRGILHDRAMIEAAAGRFESATAYLGKFKKQVGDEASFRTTHLTSRLADWKRFHGLGAKLQLTQSTSDIFGSKDTQQDLTSPSDSGDSASSDGKKKDKHAGKMTLVDVVIIRSEERHITGKGVNLLNGLQVTLSGTIFSANDVRTRNMGAADTRVTTYTINPTIAFPTITYSLNIFNNNEDRNDVLARPTLVALNGKKSEFFTGAVFHVELTGAAGSEGNVEEVPVGIHLEVTPKFGEADDRVQLSVMAQRAFVESRSNSIGFNNFAQVTKTRVAANATIKFGDTLVLSGLSERETEKLKDGVPLLQNLPGVQYFFSREDTLDFTKSVLILVTPRAPRYTYEDGTPMASKDAKKKAKQPNLNELKGRLSFRPAPNLAAVFQHLKDGRLFREFRTGDVTMETWEARDVLERMIDRTVDFLYF